MKNSVDAVARFLLGLRRPSKATNARLLHNRGETLHPPTYQIRERQWREQFKKPTEAGFVLWSRITAASWSGLQKVESYASGDLPGYSGELNKIYLLRQYQRLGLGRRLVGHVARRFLDQGVSTMVLFGIPQNPSCAFH